MSHLIDRVSNTIHVAKNGNNANGNGSLSVPYLTVPDGITAAAALGSGSIVAVWPGTYDCDVDGAITGNENVTIVGFGARGTVKITGVTTATLYTFPATGGSVWYISFELSPEADGKKIFTSTAGRHSFHCCKFKITSATNGIVSSYGSVSAGEIRLMRCRHEYDMTGTSGGSKDHKLIEVTGTGNVLSYSGEFKDKIADADDNLYTIHTTSTVADEMIIFNSKFLLTASNATYSGNVCALYNGTTTASLARNVEHCHIHCEATGGAGVTGTGMAFNAAHGNAIWHGTANRVLVEGFARNYFGNKTGHLISHGCDIVAPDGVVGTGTYTRVNFPSDGELDVDIIQLHDVMHSDQDFTALAVGESKTVVDVTLETDGSAGGDVHVIDVSIAGTAGSAEAVAVATHQDVDVIHQHLGDDVALDYAWSYDDSGTAYTNVTTNFNDAAADVQVFVADDDSIFIGVAAKYDEISVLLSINSSISITPTFGYSTADDTFTAFTPNDNTGGFVRSGIIRFSKDLAGWAAVQVNGQGNYYWIKILRTKNNLVTPPTVDKIQVRDTDVKFLSWDKLGNISGNTLGGIEQAADPSDPDSGKFTIWQSDGTGTGADGDILIKITDNGGTTKTTTLVTFAAI